MKRKPPKPTEPFGHIAFGKDGSVAKHIDQLSTEKEDQEAGAMRIFLKSLGVSFPSLKIHRVQQLKEAGHDFVLQTSAGAITVQLTELVERDYARPITAEEYNRGRYREIIQRESPEIHWGIDTEHRDTALRRVIQNKVEKNYAKDPGETLWLVVFSTSAYFLTTYFKAGQRRESRALTIAYEYLDALEQLIFDEVWYTNLQTRPVRIWPLE
jgi:hypothetical protein